MKNIFFIAFLSMFMLACGDTKPEVSKTPIEKKTTSEENELQPVAAHSTDKESDAKVAATKTQAPPIVQKSEKKTKWTRSGTPIDVSKFNADISKAEKDLKANSNDEGLKKKLSEAYTKRGVALTEARQYASAIGDYRRALKYNKDNADAKKWIATITNIYKSINREVPGEGEEPKPLDFEKKKA